MKIDRLASDISASFVVFLVALPLCLGISLASEAPLVSGLIAGVVGGILVGILSGSALSVSGPAAGLTVIVASGIRELGTFETFQLAVVVCGVLQILFALIKLHRVAGIFPASVIKGMLAAIGLLIILKQIPHALGRDETFEGNLDFLSATGSNTFADIVKAVLSAHPGAVLLSVISLFVLIVWDKVVIKKIPNAKWVPGPLIVVVIGILLNMSFGSSPLAILNEHLVQIPLTEGLWLFSSTSPDWSSFTNPAIYKIGFVLAVVASIETLLSVEAIDRLDPMHRISNSRKELFAQGAGNTVSAFLGGLPLTAVIVRGSANVYSGAKTRYSAILHGVFLLFAVWIFASVLNQIPLASLACILIIIGYKLTSKSLVMSVYRDGPDQFVPFVVTIIAILLTDLLTGVLIGLFVGILIVVLSNSYSSISVVSDGKDHLLRFTKDVSFLNKIRLKRELAKVPAGSRLWVDGSRAAFIDQDIYDILEDYKKSADLNGVTLSVSNVEGKKYPSFMKKLR